MATTLSTDLIIPEVLADMIGPLFEEKLVLAQVSDTDTTLVGRPGDEITFNRWNYAGMADILTENVPMVPRKLTTSSTKARIKEAGEAFELTDTATLTALGNPGSAAQQNLALGIADRIDFELRKAAELTEDVDGTTYAPLSVPAQNRPLSWNLLTQAFAKFGALYDPRNLTLIIHSTQHIQLLNDPRFIDATSFGAGAVMLTGQIGAIGTIPVLLSDRATAVADLDGAAGGAQAGINALLVRRGALSLKYKRRPVVETGRDILNRSDVLATNVHFGVKRTDDKGVVVIPTNAEIPQD
jgi:N4-gp56 family major capsid protein